MALMVIMKKLETDTAIPKVPVVVLNQTVNKFSKCLRSNDEMGVQFHKLGKF